MELCHIKKTQQLMEMHGIDGLRLVSYHATQLHRIRNVTINGSFPWKKLSAKCSKSMLLSPFQLDDFQFSRTAT